MQHTPRCIQQGSHLHPTHPALGLPKRCGTTPAQSDTLACARKIQPPYLQIGAPSTWPAGFSKPDTLPCKHWVLARFWFWRKQTLHILACIHSVEALPGHYSYRRLFHRHQQAQCTIRTFLDWCGYSLVHNNAHGSETYLDRTRTKLGRDSSGNNTVQKNVAMPT